MGHMYTSVRTSLATAEHLAHLESSRALTQRGDLCWHSVQNLAGGTEKAGSAEAAVTSYVQAKRAACRQAKGVT